MNGTQQEICNWASDGDTAAHHLGHSLSAPRAEWLVRVTPEGGSAIEYNWAAQRPAEPGELDQENLILSADMSARWDRSLKRNPRTRFRVEVTPQGTRVHGL